MNIKYIPSFRDAASRAPQPQKLVIYFDLENLVLWARMLYFFREPLVKRYPTGQSKKPRHFFLLVSTQFKCERKKYDYKVTGI